ncbi:hypothetical protein VTI74DRAFT_9576 [Chaetomium olivicolor]
MHQNGNLDDNKSRFSFLPRKASSPCQIGTSPRRLAEGPQRGHQLALAARSYRGHGSPLRIFSLQAGTKLESRSSQRKVPAMECNDRPQGTARAQLPDDPAAGLPTTNNGVFEETPERLRSRKRRLDESLHSERKRTKRVCSAQAGGNSNGDRNGDGDTKVGVSSRTGDTGDHLVRAPLTRKNLSLFDKMTRQGKKISTSGPADSASDSPTKTISTTTTGFANQAFTNGILPPVRSEPPKNLDEIRERLARSRGSPQPPALEYRCYTSRVGSALTENTVIVTMSPTFVKGYHDEGYRAEYNQAFSAFPREVGFNNGLSPPHPDFVEGFEKAKYYPLPVDEYISGAVLYKDEPLSLVLPHVAGEWKRQGKDMREAQWQSAYDGAALVYARNQALSYLGKSDAPGVAEVFTFITDGTILNVFAHYAAETEDGRLQYHQYPVSSTLVTPSYEEFQEGRRRFRNMQDHARERSLDLKKELLEHWQHSLDREVMDDTNIGEAAARASLQPWQAPPAVSGASRDVRDAADSASASAPTSQAVVEAIDPNCRTQKRKASPLPPHHRSRRGRRARGRSSGH